MSEESVSTRAELSEEASITKIQAHARGSQVRKRGSIKDLVLKLTPSKMGAESVTKETSGLGALTASALARPVKAAAAVSEELRADVGEMNRKVTKALENHLEFSFLASDTHPMHGLQDWSTAEWATKIEQHPELSALLAQTLQLNVGHDGSTPRDPCDLALELKKALALTQLFPDPDTPTLTAFRVQSYSQDTIGKPATTLILALILAPTGSLALTRRSGRRSPSRGGNLWSPTRTRASTPRTSSTTISRPSTCRQSCCLTRSSGETSRSASTSVLRSTGGASPSRIRVG